MHQRPPASSVISDRGVASSAGVRALILCWMRMARRVKCIRFFLALPHSAQRVTAVPVVAAHEKKRYDGGREGWGSPFLFFCGAA